MQKKINKKTLKKAKSPAPDLSNEQKSPKTDHSIAICSIFLWVRYILDGTSCLKFLKVTDFAMKSGLPTSEITKNSPKNISLNRDLLNFFNRYGRSWVIPGESSCPDGSEYIWQRGVGRI